MAKYRYTTDRNFYLSELEYGNQDKVTYTYDDLGRVTKETYEDGDTVSYKYDNNGALATVTDSATGRTTTYYYDFTDRLMKYAEKGSGFLHSVTYGYNQQNLLWTEEEVINGTSAKISYTYDDDNRVTRVYNSRTTSRQDYTYNVYGLVQYRRAYHGSSQVLQTHHTYRMPNSTTVTPQISKLTHTAANYSSTFQYKYDAKGNITEVINGGKSTTYVYDSANQLLRENNEAGGYTYVWTYDDAGNILTRTEYAYTTGTLGTATDTVNYTYGDSQWKDLLTVYDGQSITYDTIGNPTSYYNGTRWSFSWEHGRELTTASDGTSTWTYTYDANGMRTKRTNGSTTYEYVYNGSRLTQLTIDKNGTVNQMYFVYDASGPFAINANGTTYYYVKNAQGDITAIVNKAGTAVVTYSYDAWGNLLSIDGEYKNGLGLRNPLRYRGYVYDTETGFYYLQSRYYDPQIGRFINADAYASTGQGLLGNNMFAYCLNNPVMHADSLGNMPCSAMVVQMNDEGRITHYGEGTAITVSIYGQTVYIDAYITFHGDLDPDTLIQGIKQYWEGTYSNGIYSYNVVVNIHKGSNENGNTVDVYAFTGNERGFCFSLPFSWSTTRESTVVLWSDYYKYIPYTWTMAHEFGHCLGVGDYYTQNGKPGFYDQFPSIMNIAGHRATFNDIIKVIDAARYNVKQEWHCIGGL